FFLPLLALAQSGEVVEGVIKRVKENYVFPEVAQKMERRLRERLQNKEYDGLNGEALAKALTGHLQEVSQDKHLRVFFSAEPRPARPNPGPPSPEEKERYRQTGALRNFGFHKVERLEGNVGLLDLDGFSDTEFGGATAAAAMNFLANSSALIIDLRHNGGGDPAMVALISTYLFDAPVVHLNDLYWRSDDSTHQWWTLPYVPGQRFGKEKDVYVLTSPRTFSAAEEFTYNLKNLKRAIIVGETTGGGAHPGGGYPIDEHFGMFVPTGRAINPISKTNWEGKGVAPDIALPAAEALKTAHLDALKKLIGKAKDPRLAKEIQQAVDGLK
ncbi:MAG: S41 family peptidase, partial [Acidobacteria bacterium]|nr:S41 family peptidase [Acidobacteriota bacterium]